MVNMQTARAGLCDFAQAEIKSDKSAHKWKNHKQSAQKGQEKSASTWTSYEINKTQNG